jgi:hypothetical protein
MRAAAMHSRQFHDEQAAVGGVPWWGVFCSAVAPLLLVAGWTVAAGLQPRPSGSMPPGSTGAPGT